MQPEFWRAGAQVTDNFGSSTKVGLGLTPEYCLKKYIRIGALYCICYIQIVNLVNFNVLLFLFYLKKNNAITMYVTT